MWLEDRANDEKDRNERRKRHGEARRNSAIIDDYLGVLTDQVDDMPEEGTEEYDELVEDLREEMLRTRQRNQDE